MGFCELVTELNQHLLNYYSGEMCSEFRATYLRANIRNIVAFESRLACRKRSHAAQRSLPCCASPVTDCFKPTCQINPLVVEPWKETRFLHFIKSLRNLSISMSLEVFRCFGLISRNPAVSCPVVLWLLAF